MNDDLDFFETLIRLLKGVTKTMETPYHARTLTPMSNTISFRHLRRDRVLCIGSLIGLKTVVCRCRLVSLTGIQFRRWLLRQTFVVLTHES